MTVLEAAKLPSGAWVKGIRISTVTVTCVAGAAFVQAKVEQRGKLVDVADTALVQNLDKTKAVVMKSKEQYKR